MIYLMYFVTTVAIGAITVSFYCAAQVSKLEQQLDHLEGKFIHTLESLDFVLSKLDVVRESLKSIKHDVEDVDDTDWWKKQ